jgi:uncharacterized protein
MKIDVSNLFRVKGSEYEFDFKECLSDLKVISNEFKFSELVHASGKVMNKSGILNVSGQIETDCNMTCSRCLTETRTSLNLDFRENFVLAETLNDEDSYVFDGKYIVLDQAIYDNILLNLPMRYICSKKCKGLCQGCGNNLNTTKCNCLVDVIDERLQKLGDYFNKK